MICLDLQVVETPPKWRGGNRARVWGGGGGVPKQPRCEVKNDDPGLASDSPNTFFAALEKVRLP